jgi:hypothetical protein
LSQISPLHATSYCLKISFNIILHVSSCSQVSSPKTCVYLSSPPYVSTPHPSHYS